MLWRFLLKSICHAESYFSFVRFLTFFRSAISQRLFKRYLCAFFNERCSHTKMPNKKLISDTVFLRLIIPADLLEMYKPFLRTVDFAECHI